MKRGGFPSLFVLPKEGIVMDNLNFYILDTAYVEYLKNTEIAARGFSRVPDMVYEKSRKQKFLCGIVLSINEMDYYVPVTSFKKKMPDNFLIEAEKGKVTSSLRFNYMFPVPKDILTIKNISKEPDDKYKILLSKELKYCIKNQDEIRRLAKRTYKRVVMGKDNGLVHNSCDFALLEKAYISYCQENGIELPKVLQEQINLKNNQSNVSQTNTTSGSKAVEINKKSMMKLSNLTRDEFEILIQSKIDCKFIKNEKGITAIFRKEDAEKVRAALTQDQEVEQNHKPPKR